MLHSTADNYCVIDCAVNVGVVQLTYVCSVQT